MTPAATSARRPLAAHAARPAARSTLGARRCIAASGLTEHPMRVGHRRPVSRVDFNQLFVGPFDGVFGRHALDGLCIHLGNGIFADRLGEVGPGGPE